MKPIPSASTTKLDTSACPVRWVCLSDLHLGEEGSLLSCLRSGSCECDPSATSPTLQALGECLVRLFETKGSEQKLTLILAGDVLDLATAPDHEALEVFRRFLEPLMKPRKLFDNIVYIPGNHDHHIWETAREDCWAEAIEQDASKHKGYHALNWSPHITSPRCGEGEGFDSKLLSIVGRLAGGDSPIQTFYPNFLLWHENRCALFTHGHFAESYSRLMSDLDQDIFPEDDGPKSYLDLERRNFAWIDFAWSTLGRSGKAGEKVEKVWDLLQTSEGKGELTAVALSLLAGRLGIPRSLRRVADPVLRRALRKLAGFFSFLRMETDKAFDDAMQKQLLYYLNGPFLEDALGDCIPQVANELTLVVGHTHKPYAHWLDVSEVVEKSVAYPGSIAALNTGGWVVDGHEPKEARGGAIVMLDEALNAASLRLYNERPHQGAYRVTVETVPGVAPTPLSTWLEQRVQVLPDCFARFSQAAAADVHLRLAMRRAMTEGKKVPERIAGVDLPWPSCA